ncbi:dihydrodipicolinate synthase family protein, partial [Nostoc sp. UIC 10630]|uniref:dihydrodipicolinate synthase family protein n=1 Tax=Nostoc sp. UIC 10630 TaxID=2100146 RepID=UPI0013FB0A94
LPGEPVTGSKIVKIGEGGVRAAILPSGMRAFSTRIKEETGDIRRVTDMYVAFGDRFSIFCGVDDLIVESSALGVTGWVSGMTNVWPAECVELFNLCAENRYAEARALYRILTPSLQLATPLKHFP